MRSGATRDTILIVDDEPQVLVALEDLLSDEFRVLKSDSAERALRLVEEEPNIAVVISDQRMPRMAGDELFQRLRARFAAERILATGYADLTAVIRAVNEGQIFAYVTKPWEPEDLRVKIQRAADQFRLTRELAHERKRLDDLMMSIPDAIYFKDAELRFERVNEAALSLFPSQSTHGVVGRRLSELLAGSDTAFDVEAEERQLLRQNRVAKDTVRGFLVDGEARWFSSTRAPIVDSAGAPIGLVGISRDVTSRVRMEEALRLREEQLQLTFLASSAGLFDWDLVADCVERSPSLVEMIPVGHEPGGELMSQVHPDDLPLLHEAVQRHFADRTPLRGLELRARASNGEYGWFELSARAVWSESGVPLRLVGSFTDICQRKRQEARIRSLTRTHALLSGINSTILRVHERAALLRESCELAVRVGGLSLAVAAQSRLGDDGHVVAWAGTASESVASIGSWLAVEGGRAGGELERSISLRAPIVVDDLRRQHGMTELGSSLLAAGHLSMAIVPVMVSGHVDVLLALFADRVSFFDDDQVKLLAELGDNIGFALEHGAQKQRLDFLAYYDELTGLANRQLLEVRSSEQLEACSEAGQRLAVVLVDIERFRHVNNTLGRRAGDLALIEIARRLSVACHGKWSLARYASNTFAVVLAPVEDTLEVETWVGEALATLGQTVSIAGMELRLSARAGIALFPESGRGIDALLANAEVALKSAKESSRRRVFHSAEMNGHVAERLSLETRLRIALEQQQFLLHYQPKVELKTGRVVGLEALIRWLGPDGKLIAPGLFIPLLEETGMIVEVGKWVMETAARQYAEWSARALAPPRIAVNVSPLQLGQPDFVRSIEGVLQAFPLASAGLDLEITESVLMADLTGNVEKLRRAREAGLGVSIDDFGTGYSSLGYISRLPIDALKVDRSFVTRMSEDPREMAIVTTIISLAHALDLKVVAEGVETAQQAQLLRLLKCDQAQGYLIAKPQAADDVLALLTQTFDFSRKVA